jgi:hypothetical protein
MVALSEAIAEAEWGWDTYQRTLWKRDDPDGTRRLYIGKFLSLDLPPGYSTCTIRFWARKPVLAMRAIAKSGKHPSEFADTNVN